METGNETIIMVDDDITNLTVGASNLEDRYNVFTAPSGKKLFQMLEKITPSLILLDIDMPEMNGYEVIRILKSSERTENIPVIFLTAKIDPESEVKGLSLGAVDYITKPFSKELLVKRIDLHIVFEKQKIELMNYSHSLEGEVSQKTKIVFELQNAILKTVAELVERRDSITGGHIERTQHYLGLLFDFLLEHGVYSEELSVWNLDLFIMSSQLHDVGKISIRDDILLKPDKLDADEMDIMKKHTTYGVEIIKRIEESTSENEFLKCAEILAGSHHEKWDGSGYPLGLKGEDIPLQGRIMAIVDVYDALTNDRPYKTAFTHEESIRIIKAGRGTHFDPQICDVFIGHEKEFGSQVIERTVKNDGGESVNKLHDTLKMVANIVDVRNGNGIDGDDRIRKYLEIFIDALKTNDNYKNEVSSWDLSLFLMSAPLYDVGKIAVSDNILGKPEKLTDEELEYVKTHADVGLKIIQQIRENVNNGSLLNHAEALAGSHHERWDGTGYPLGLKGKGIPLQGRIMAIVDVYEALTSQRPHRSKQTREETLEIIKSYKGTYFDPDLVDIFLEIEQEFEKEFEKEEGLE